MSSNGLSMFSYDHRTSPSSYHPRDFDPEDMHNADWYQFPMQDNPDFGRWRTPGRPIIRVPAETGTALSPEDEKDVIHGELVSPEEEDAADKILNGDHDSPRPSSNPFVEHAREDLGTPGSEVAVHVLSRLLNGEHPDSMSQEDINAAHEYLGQHFSRVKANPRTGTVRAGSPYGSQIIRRHVGMPAMIEPDETEPHKPMYSLVNKHGTFESADTGRIIKTMLAFQIVHNEFAEKAREAKERQERAEEDDDDDDKKKIKSTSARNKPSDLPKPTPMSEIPPTAVFEPGAGTDVNEAGVRGGWVAYDMDAPDHWNRDVTSVAYSPGHHMNQAIDPKKASIPIPDEDYPGHTYTYAPNHQTGHTIERHGGGARYYATPLHPAVRHGLDVPRSPSPPTPPAPPSPSIGSKPERHWYKRRPNSSGTNFGKSSSDNSNDLCPVCVSGYLEPYDSEFHECLNCGSLVKHVGFEKKAARTPGLGRGLKDIEVPEGDPFRLADTEKVEDEPEVPDEPENGYVHPLAGAEPDPDFVPYEAPRGRLMDRKASPMPPEDTLDKRMADLGLMPLHKPGELRGYWAKMPGDPDAFVRITEMGRDKGWHLTADHILSPEKWSQGGEEYPFNEAEFQVGHDVANPMSHTDPKWLKLVDPSNRSVSRQMVLARGSHPLGDAHLNSALKDMMQNGKKSLTYRQAIFDTAYEPPRLPVRGPDSRQRDLRMLSSELRNPGMAVFTGE